MPWRGFLEKLNGNAMNWLMTVLLALMGFLGVSIWNGQQDLTRATFENTLALRQLTVEFKAYQDRTEELRVRMEKAQDEINQKIDQRLNSAEKK